jgi:hypothetical protein
MSKELNERERQQEMEIACRVMRDNREALSALADAGQETEQMDLARKFMRENRAVLRDLSEGCDGPEKEMDIEEDARAEGIIIPDEVGLVRTPPEDGSRRRWKRRDEGNTPPKA